MTEAIETPDHSTPQPVAPLWHMLGVVVLLIAWVGLTLSHYSMEIWSALPAAIPRKLIAYLQTIVIEWIVFGFIWIGVRAHGLPFKALFGAVSMTPRKILRDVGIAIAYVVVANIVLGILTQLLHVTPNAAVKGMLPRNPVEIGIFLFLAFTAAMCEETIFRGYLQRQLSAWLNSAVLGAILQGVLFGVAHFYQGWKMVLVIAIYGCLFGALALWRKSLRPGIIAHFLQDGVSGMVFARLT